MSSKKFDLKINSKILPFKKVITVDSDKSLSIRSLLVGSISEGVSKISNILESEDVFSTINCLRKLGVKVQKKKSKNYHVFGKGLGSLIAKKNTVLDFGNSGTLTRLLIGILTTTPGLELKITGDQSLKKRSMKKIFNLMEKFGATFSPKNKFNLPVKITASNMPLGIDYLAGVSAQLKSAVILAGLNSFGETRVIENERSRDHTEKLLLKNSKSIQIENKKQKIIKVLGKKSLKSINAQISGDPSSASFFSALALLKKDSSIKIKKVGLNPTRIGFYLLLKKHGAKIKFINIKKKNNENVGDIIIDSCRIRPIKASKEYYVNSTDEYPILFIIAALTKGISVFKGIEDLKNKESNRIVEMQKVLKQVGIKSKFSNGQLKIFGKGIINGKDKKIYVSNLGDHRICMSAFVLSTLIGANTKIKNFETVNTSSPSFLKIMRKLGAKYEIQK